jgi:hypothetical protein
MPEHEDDNPGQGGLGLGESEIRDHGPGPGGYKGQAGAGADAGGVGEKMMKRMICIVVVLCAANLYGQGVDKNINENPRVKSPFGLSFNLGGPTYVASASVDYFILPVLNIETGAGIWGYYLGPKYHFKGNAKKDKTLYIGSLLCIYPPNESFQVLPSGGDWKTSKKETNYGYYLPIGFTNISENGYTFSMEIAYSSKTISDNIPFWFSFKFGYHF